MGYYTKHRLEILDAPTDKKTNEEIFADIKNNESIGYAFDELDELGDEVKGYELENDMKEFSKKYPYKIFKIYGEGEETGDIWEMLICNGRGKKKQAQVLVPEIKLDELE